MMHPDGTVETYTVTKVAVLHPATQQVRLTPMVAQVIPSNVTLINRKTGKVVKHTHYYTFSQSFHSGPGARGDALGGFCTGQMVECYEETARRNMRKLLRDGFQLVN
jgi:hypothetical protein